METAGYSELHKLASCERQWAYVYLWSDDSENVEKSVALRKGTTLHQLIAGYETGDEQAALSYSIAAHDAPRDLEHLEDALWIFDRYKRYYGGQRWRVVVNEMPMSAMLPGTDVLFKTRGIDGIVQIDAAVDPEHAGLWHLERKTMKDWQRLAMLPVDAQITTAQWMLREAGWPIRGTVYDAIRTYRFTPKQLTLAELKLLHPKLHRIDEYGDLRPETNDEYSARLKLLQSASQIEAPLEDSFRRVFETRTDAQIEAQIEELTRGVRRRNDLRDDFSTAFPIRNLDRQCGWCSFRDDCWHSLRFNDEIRLSDMLRDLP